MKRICPSVFGIAVVLLILFRATAFSEEQPGTVPIDSNLVVFASDMHLGPNPEIRVAKKREKGIFLRYYQKPIEKEERVIEYDSRATFRRFVREVMAMNPRPAEVLLLGDIASNTGRPTYAEYREMLRPFDQAGIKYRNIMGNHDHFENFYSCFPDKGQSLVDIERWQGFRIELPRVDLVLMQTFAPRGGDRKGSLLRLMTNEEKAYMKQKSDAFIYIGWLIPEQRNWMKEQACLHPSKPILFCGHHPVELEKSFPDYKTLANFQGWICGHYHHFYQTNRQNSNRLLYLPSTGAPGIGYNTDGPGYVIMKITDKDYRFTFITFDPQERKNGETIVWPVLNR